MNIQNVHSETYLKEGQSKIMPLDKIIASVKGTCIFTKGVFDLLHYGHLSLFLYLNKLKNDFNCKIVVAISSDEIVKLKKGDKRPINPEMERALQIALLPQVDFVFINNSGDLPKIVSELKPAFFIKGIDTTEGNANSESLVKKNSELKEMEDSSIAVIFSDDQSISTSAILKRVASKL